MSLLTELEGIVQSAREWERVQAHVREVVTRPVFKEAFGIDPDEVDSEWIVRNFANILDAAAKHQKNR